MDQQNTFIWEEHIPGGCHWSGIVRRGTTLRLVDVEGGANAAVLLFNQEEKLERYNMADTLKSQHTFRLTRGHFLLHYCGYRRLARQRVRPERCRTDTAEIRYRPVSGAAQSDVSQRAGRHADRAGQMGLGYA